MARILSANLTDSITLKRDGVSLAAQRVRVRRVAQTPVTEGEPISTGAASLEIIGLTSLDIQADDTFTWDGARWVVTSTPVIGTDNVSRKATAEMRV
jgi:hypothetical protein